MAKATLVIMAAGIGSRFGGGIKQLEPVGPNGEIIMDYSIYDALKAGFDKVVFVIRKDLEKDFKEIIGKRIEKVVEVAYAFQEKDQIPEPYKTKYSDRIKPWGTGQAILCCKEIVKEPFLVINADDFYGRESFRVAYEYLMQEENGEKEQIGMVGFVLGNTLSDNGSVTRGICKADENHMLTDIVETKGILKDERGMIIGNGIPDGSISSDSLVSMNMWMLGKSFLDSLQAGFDEFLEVSESDYMNVEYLLPIIVGDRIRKKQLEVAVLETKETWFGVTYKEDKETVKAAIQNLLEQKIYPEKLF